MTFLLQRWIELGWINQLVNFWFYAPKFAEVMVIQKLWVLYSLVCRRHLAVPATWRSLHEHAQTKVDLSIRLTWCYFKCFLVSLLKVSRRKIFKFAHNTKSMTYIEGFSEKNSNILIKTSYLPRLLGEGLTCETLENMKVAASLNVKYSVEVRFWWRHVKTLCKKIIVSVTVLLKYKWKTGDACPLSSSASFPKDQRFKIKKLVLLRKLQNST